jgi:hypothetical protein
MISIRVQRCRGNVTVRFRVTAPSIERALEIAGEGTRVVFPIDGEEFFVKATPSTRESPNEKVA